tara:strand:- start:664 stop:1113 length:450 start_codon:yes stop_codon:yes gene_type:complete
VAKILYIDLDDTLVDFRGAYLESLRLDPSVPFPQSKRGFFADLKPIDGAIEAVQILIKAPEYEPYILSAPSTRNVHSYSEKRLWVESYFGFDFCDRLILSEHKNLLRGDILIDDHASGKGQDEFQGELVVFGSVEYPDWETVLSHLGIS